MKKSTLALSITVLAILGAQTIAAQTENPLNTEAPKGDSTEMIAPEFSDLDLRLREARRASNEGKTKKALSLFREIEKTDSLSHKWAAVSGQIHIYRRQGDFQAAHAITARMMKAEPEAAGLMHIWNGDMYIQSGKYDKAIEEYRIAEQQHGDSVVNTMTMGEVALKQSTRAAIQFEHPDQAADFARRMAQEYPDSGNPEAALASALVYEAMANGDLPIKTLETLQYAGDCTAEEPCVIANKHKQPKKKMENGAFQQLNSLSGFYFKLNPSDRGVLERIRNEETQNQSSYRSRNSNAQSYTTCAAENDSAAADGFSDPISGMIHGGNDMFMTYPAGASTSTTSYYHPGLDMNNANDHANGDTYDCSNPDDGFTTVATGCVQDASTAGWGSIAVTHDYFPYDGDYAEDYITSQYGHADEVSVSVGDSVYAGEEIGSIGGVGSSGTNEFACHLHLEIREQDHPDPYNASYWNTDGYLESQDTTGEFYQDPDTFIDAHGAADWGYWIDESSSLWSYTGTWNYVNTKGNGNDLTENDLNYATTTSSSSPNATATLTFTAQNTGSHSLWMFVPWSNGDKSDAVPAEITDSNGTSVLSTTLDFYGDEVEGYGTCDRDPDGNGVWDDFDSSKRCDEWIEIGTVSLTEGEEYELEIANNTGSSSDIIIIDDLYIQYDDTSTVSLQRVASTSDDETTCSVSSGDWSISSDCTLSTDVTAAGNVTVEDGVTLTITGDGSLNVDLNNYHLRVGDGSRVIIETGGKIY